jgi:hypothetical protein
MSGEIEVQKSQRFRSHVGGGGLEERLICGVAPYPSPSFCSGHFRQRSRLDTGPLRLQYSRISSSYSS